MHSCFFAEVAIVRRGTFQACPAVLDVLSRLSSSWPVSAPDVGAPPTLLNRNYCQELAADLREWWPLIADAEGHGSSSSRERVSKLERHLAAIDRWSSGSDLVADAGGRGAWGQFQYGVETLLCALFSARNCHRRDSLMHLQRAARLLLGRDAAEGLCARF